MTPDKIVIGSATLYLGDCREVLPEIGGINAVISDPPYGQAVNTNVRRNGNRSTGAGGPIRERPVPYPLGIVGDDAPFDPSPLLRAEIVALWGAHKFADRLPEGSWLCWDKVPNGKVRDQGDGEAAWLNHRGRPLRIFRHLWDGLCIAGGYETRNERIGQAAMPRHHPTQKPVDLMSWTIRQARIPAGGLICDPYMGAGSTGIAAVLAGHPFVGIECEPLYFEAACERIEKAQRQGQLLRDSSALGCCVKDSSISCHATQTSS